MLQKIVKKINAKGWNIYQVEGNLTLNDVVPPGPVSQLEIGKQYHLYPTVSNPTDVQQVLNSFRYCIQRNIPPIIIFDGEPMSLLPFYVDDNDIDIRGIGGSRLSYTKFLESLDTLEAIVGIN